MEKHFANQRNEDIQAVKEELERQADEKREESKRETENPQEETAESSNEKVKNFVDAKVKGIEEAASGMTNENPQTEAENANKSIGLSPEKLEEVSKRGFKEKIIEHSKKVLVILNEFRKKVEDLSYDFMGGNRESDELLEKKEKKELEEKSKEKENDFETKKSPKNDELYYDPERELKKIRTGTKEERTQKLTEFKEKLNEQKRGIAEIQKMLLRKIEANPDARYGDLFNSELFDLVDSYSLSEKQRKAFADGIDAYLETHKAIKENTEDFMDKETGDIDGSKLYEKLFGKRPEGRVAVILRPATIYLRIENLDDYAMARKHGDIQETNDEIRKEADKSSGCKLSNFHIKGLENSITLEKATGGNFDEMSQFSKSVMDHEEQHAINALIRKGYNPEERKKDNLWDKHHNRMDKYSNSKEHKEYLEKYGEKAAIERYWEVSDEDYGSLRKVEAESGIERRIKDEISAYFKDGGSPEGIREILLKPETIYRYGFDYNGGKEEKSEFSKKYIDMVENGILAYNHMLKAGYSIEDTQALLFVEPLSKWMKVVERMGIKRKETGEEKFDEKQAGENLKGVERKAKEFNSQLEKELEGVNNRLDLFKLFDQINNKKKFRVLDRKLGFWSLNPGNMKYVVGQYLDGKGSKVELSRIPKIFRKKVDEIFKKEHGI